METPVKVQPETMPWLAGANWLKTAGEQSICLVQPGQESTTVAVTLILPQVIVTEVPHSGGGLLVPITLSGKAMIISLAVFTPPQLPRPGV